MQSTAFLRLLLFCRLKGIVVVSPEVVSSRARVNSTLQDGLAEKLFVKLGFYLLRLLKKARAI